MNGQEKPRVWRTPKRKKEKKVFFPPEEKEELEKLAIIRKRLEREGRVTVTPEGVKIYPAIPEIEEAGNRSFQVCSGGHTLRWIHDQTPRTTKAERYK